MGENAFLMIDGYTIQDAEEGCYSAYETELSTTQRMASGRLVEERQGTVWVVELTLDALTSDDLSGLFSAMSGSRDHVLFFLPSTGGTSLATGTFHLSEQPKPKLRSWFSASPLWGGYTLRFEEVRPHA